MKPKKKLIYGLHVEYTTYNPQTCSGPEEAILLSDLRMSTPLIECSSVEEAESWITTLVPFTKQYSPEWAIVKAVVITQGFYDDPDHQLLQYFTTKVERIIVERITNDGT